MNEKNITKINLSTIFLIFAIIAIIVMGIFIYKLNNDKTAEIKKSTELQAQVDNLSETVNDLQEKTNSISENKNSNTSKDNTTLSNETTNTNNSSLTNEVSNSKTSDSNYTDITLNGIYAIPNTDISWEFTKDGKAYSVGNMNVMRGTYKTTGNNSVEIHYTENKIWDDEISGKVNIEKVDIYEYITIDNNGNINLKNQDNETVKLEKYGDSTPNAY